LAALKYYPSVKRFRDGSAAPSAAHLKQVTVAGSPIAVKTLEYMGQMYDIERTVVDASREVCF
jgi:hypothetical protein